MGSFIAKPQRGDMLVENGLMLFPKPQRGDMLVENKLNVIPKAPTGRNICRKQIGTIYLLTQVCFKLKKCLNI